MEVIIMGRKDLEKITEMPKVIEKVIEAYKSKSNGKTTVWPLVSYDFTDEKAVMDIRSGCDFDENVHGLKMLNNFPLNKEKNLPSFNGMLMIFDSKTGIPLGVMDAAYITCMRTGAAGAIGAKVLARPDSTTLFILGAGKQSIYQIAATLILLPRINKVFIADPIDYANAEKLSKEIPLNLATNFGIERAYDVDFEPVTDMPKSIGQSDVIITVTPSRMPIIKKDWVKPGTHFSCIGADMEGKEEIDSEIFIGAKIFADDKKQCIRVGEMELPIKHGKISPDDVKGEIGDVLAEKISGRESDSDITIFDATGLAILDLVTGKAAIESAKAKGFGMRVEI